MNAIFTSKKLHICGCFFACDWNIPRCLWNLQEVLSSNIGHEILRKVPVMVARTESARIHCPGTEHFILTSDWNMIGRIFENLKAWHSKKCESWTNPTLTFSVSTQRMMSSLDARDSANLVWFIHSRRLLVCCSVVGKGETQKGNHHEGIEAFDFMYNVGK